MKPANIITQTVPATNPTPAACIPLHSLTSDRGLIANFLADPQPITQERVDKLLSRLTPTCTGLATTDHLLLALLDACQGK